MECDDTVLRTTPLPPASSMPTIVVVADDERVRRSRGNRLSEENYDVALCANGREALDPIEHGWIPTVVVVDATMPVMDGTTGIARLKRNPVTARIPVVAIGAGLTLQRQMNELVQADGLLPKPFDPDHPSVIAEHRVRTGSACGAST